MDFLKRPLAITDIETTGLDAERHEIIDIAVLLANQETLEVLDEFDTRIKPQNINPASGLAGTGASKKALEISGYTERKWMTAMNLKETIGIYAKKAEGAIFTTDNVYFDWSFMVEAFKQTYVEDLLHHRRLDIFTLAWSRAAYMPGLKKFYLEDLCKYFNIAPEPLPHSAINGVRKKHQILKKLYQLTDHQIRHIDR